MKIHHYTSIETLALILKNKTIRFNRLDQVDDVEESKYKSGSHQLMLSKYAFVSCWTKEDEDNISLWKMYTNLKGVKISIEEDLFITYDINKDSKSYFNGPLHFEDNYFALSFINEAKLYDVEYVEDLKYKIDEISLNLEEKNSLLVNFNKIGIYKRKLWAFQKESRFKIILLPIDYGTKNIEDSLKSILLGIIKNQEILTTYIDVPLRNDVLSNAIITLGPQTSEADRIITESLIKEYCPSAKIVNSSIHGNIRNKF